MDDDADAEMILTAPPPENWRSQGSHTSPGWTLSNKIWEFTTSHGIKQSTWLRTVLCMALRTPRGAAGKKKEKKSATTTPNRHPYLLILLKLVTVSVFTSSSVRSLNANAEARRRWMRSFLTFSFSTETKAL